MTPESIGVVPNSHHVVVSGLAGAFGNVGLVNVRIRKRRVIFRQGVLDLVSADVQKSGFDGIGTSQHEISNLLGSQYLITID